MPLDTTQGADPYEAAGQEHGVDPTLLRALTHVESNDNDYAVSPQGAEGRAQFLPATAREMGVSDTSDKNQSIRGAARYLRENFDRFQGRPDLAIAAYHGGPDPNQWGPRTRQYLDRIIDTYSQMKQSGPQARAQADQNYIDNGPWDAPEQPAQPQTKLQEFRAKYPQYNDMGDLQLGQALHRKFYADMPFDAFASKIGLPPEAMAEPQAPGMPKTAGNQLPAITGGEPRTTKKVTLPLAQRDEGMQKPAARMEDYVPQESGDPSVSGKPARPDVSAFADRVDAILNPALDQMQRAGTILTPKAQDWMDKIQKSGGFKGFLAQLGSTAAEDIGKGLAVPGAAYAGVMGGITQLGKELGIPGLGDAVGAAMEAFPQESMGMRGVLEPRIRLTPQEAAEIKANKPFAKGMPSLDLGKRGAAYQAAEHPTPEAPGTNWENESLNELDPEHPEAPPPQGALPAPRTKPPVGPPPPDVVTPPAPPSTLGLPPPAPPRVPGRANQAQPPNVIPLPGPQARPVAAPPPSVSSPAQPPLSPWNQSVIDAAKMPPDHQVAEVIARRLTAGNPLTTKDVQGIADSIYGGTLAQGAYTRDQLYDAQELGVNRYIQNNITAPTVDADKAKQVAEHLADLKSRLPTQTVRSGEKETHQQFSTPPDYSYAAAWVANLRPGETVLEPSAGTGSLAVHALNAGAHVITNELSDKRAGMLAALNPHQIMREDATQLHNILPDTVKPTAVVMNPPFSAAPGRMGDRMVLLEGAKHVEAALSALAPGGRLVAIVGRGMTMEAPAFKQWWAKIAKQYDVRANVGVGGKIYTKYGTSFATRTLVIDKVTPSGQPVIKGDVESAADLIEKLKDIRDDRPGQQVAAQPTSPALAPPGQGAPGPGSSLPAPTGGVGPGNQPTGSAGATKPVAPPPGVGPATGPRPGNEVRPKAGAPGGNRPARQPKPQSGGSAGKPAAQPASGVEPAGSGNGGGRNASGHDDSNKPVVAGHQYDRFLTNPGEIAANKLTVDALNGAISKDEAIAGLTKLFQNGAIKEGYAQVNLSRLGATEGDWKPVANPPPETLKTNIITPEPETGGELTESVYENYKPQRVAIQGSKPHPGALVQSAAMASVQPPAPKYNTAIPRKLIESGGLSDAQLEAIVYAGDAHSKMLPPDEKGVAKRRGFFIGDGTGVGKGREVAGIILDNWMKGQKRAVWVSEKFGLSKDAERDWTGLGGSKTDIIPHSKIKAADPIQAKTGILFTTYDTVRSEEKVKAVGGQEPAEGEKKKQGKTRVQQIAEWLGKDFDGVIAFDEAHNMGNAIAMKGKRGMTQPSLRALAGIELQNQLPNARVVYVSATGATEVSNLSYADRLGLWGLGTAFPNRATFINQVNNGGVAAMELVARDMKALGHYMARNLSYDGVEYDRLLHPLLPAQRMMYDKIAEAWQVVLRNMMKALEVTGQTDEHGAAMKGSQKSGILSAFWGGHQRFFNQLITSLQMPSVIKGVERDIAEGRQAVLQLVNTNEAGQERAVEKARGTGADMEDLEDLDMSPRDQLMQLVQKAFPTTEYEQYFDAESKTMRTRPVKDAAGNFVESKEAVALREQLLDDLGSLRVPDGPLEILMNHFGPDAVAEVTGRKQRVVNKPDEKGVMKRMLDKRPAGANELDSDAFQSGKKKILVFSQAGGTGRSYHDARDAKRAEGQPPNARRSHYLVQAGWRADTAVQGFGRTHRTNQFTAPIFHLVTTDLEGQKRFISSIARRLGQLGALTKGERRTGDQGLFGLQDNLESDEAKAALTQLYRDIVAGKVQGMSPDAMQENMGLSLLDQTTGGLRADPPPMTQFLNRLLSLQVEPQNRVFTEFSNRFRDVIQHATEAGTLDAGVETYKADKIEKQSEQTVYTDKDSGAETKHVVLKTSNRNYPKAFEQIQSGQTAATGWAKPSFYVTNTKGTISAIAPSTYATTTPDGVTTEHVRMGEPLGGRYVTKDQLVAALEKGTLKRIEDDLAQAKQLWDARVAATPEFKEEPLHLITGAVLPIWDRLAGKPKIYRLQTNTGETMLGRVVDNKSIGDVLHRLGAQNTETAKLSPAEVIGKILDDRETARLANGWSIKPSLVAGEWRMELKGDDLYAHTAVLEKAGIFRERIAYDTRYFIPTGAKGVDAIKSLLKDKPVTGFGGPSAAARGGSDEGVTLYSFPAALFDLTAWRKALGIAPPTPKQAIEILRDKQGMAKAAAEVKAALAPTSLRGAKPMEREVRAHTGRSAQAYDQSSHALERVRHAVDVLSKNEQVEFTDRIETGRLQPNAGLQAVANALRKELDGWAAKVQGLGKGYLANAIEGYMGHIWGNYREWSAGQPTTQTQAQMQAAGIARNVSKKPLQGSGAFLKRRYFPTQKEGIQAGLIPVTYNPVDLQMIKIHEMQKFYHGSVLADKLKQSGIARWVRQPDQAEAERNGMVKLDDKVFQPKLYGVTPIGPVDPGAYYAPEPAARIFNNYMSAGWANNSTIYDSVRVMNNALNTLQLGLSGFHATFVAADTVISKLALGLQQIARGDIGHGLGSTAQAVAAPLAIGNTLIKGSQMRRAWLDPASATPEMRQIVEAYKMAGGRMTMPDFFRSSAGGPFFRNLSDLKRPQGALYSVAQMFRDAPPTVLQRGVMTPLRLVGRTLDTTMEPLMGQLVPRMKMGVFADLAQDWIRRNPTATPAQFSDAMIKFQDSVDNRLGQLNYDNLFWRKLLKDLAFIAMRSVGWNLGTLREIGGGLVDTAHAALDVSHLRAPQFTTRMAYLIALPVVTAMIGGLMTWLSTGQAPQSNMDYFYPPTGTTDEGGTPERRLIPGYMKDIIAARHAPGQTMLNKMSPLLSMGSQLYQGKDYYGGSIYDPQRDQSAIRAYGDFLLNQADPFTVRAMMKLHAEGANATDQALAFWGFQPAPASIMHPEKEEHSQAREAAKSYKARQKENAKGNRMDFFNHATVP